MPDHCLQKKQHFLLCYYIARCFGTPDVFATGWQMLTRERRKLCKFHLNKVKKYHIRRIRKEKSKYGRNYSRNDNSDSCNCKAYICSLQLIPIDVKTSSAVPTADYINIKNEGLRILRAA